MSDALWAAREGDALLHTSMMADIVGGVLEVAANVAITALATAAIVAATGITVATGGLGCFVLGAVVGVVVGFTMSKTGADKGLTNLCEGIGNALFPPSVQATITSGSHNTFTNGIPAARAAGKVLPVAPAGGSEGGGAEPSFLDMAGEFFSQIWRPTVASPAPGAQPCPLDTVSCTKHPPMPEQYMAEGSKKVAINGQPAVRSGDRSTCDAKVVDGGQVSPNVRIGGDSVVVREIRSGKTPGVGLAVTALLMLRGGGAKFLSRLPCLVVGGLVSFGTSKVTAALVSATSATPNPVHAATGAKVLGEDDDLDFEIPGLIPLVWQRFYSSLDTRTTVLGLGWSTPFDVEIRRQSHPDGGEHLLYVDEQARIIDMGHIALGSGVFSAGEGLAVRRSEQDQILIETVDGLYRLFEADPLVSGRYRLAQLGDRNDNRQKLEYAADGRLVALSDSAGFQVVFFEYEPEHPSRIASVTRLHASQQRETLVRYRYDLNGQLAEVHGSDNQLLRRFRYEQGLLVEHRRPSGLTCHYQWHTFQGPLGREQRVVRHWTDTGEDYRIDYDLSQGVTRVTDSLQRTRLHHWNDRYQITTYTDALGQTWQFQWNDERQLISATDPLGSLWRYAYDESGNLTQQTDPLGRSMSTEWLPHWSLPVLEVDTAGHAWRLDYDARGNLVCATDPQGRVTRHEYDERGLLIATQDPAGNRTTLRWNEAGQLVEQTDCSGYSTRYEYDSRGHLRTHIDAQGERTYYQHDARGRLLQYQLPDGRRGQLQRDAAGHLTTQVDPAGHIIGYLRDARGNVQRRTDALGHTVTFAYDAYGRLLELANENGERYRFAWDAVDRLVGQQSLDGSSQLYRYDAAGQVTTVQYTPCQDAAKTAVPIIHALERDAVGRLIAKQTRDGKTHYHYDPMDRLIEVRFTSAEEDTQSVRFSYDELGRLKAEQSDSGKLEYSYDELGNLTETLLPDGRRIRRLYYGSGHLQLLSVGDQLISRFERDRLHREVLRTQGQLSTRTDYDRCGRLRSRLRWAEGQPPQLPPMAGKWFEYDAADNLTKRMEQDGSAQRVLSHALHYDANGRLVASQVQGIGLDETFGYDAAANLLDGANGSAGLVRHNRILTYQDKRYRYDAFGRLCEKRSGSRLVQQFRYDDEHRLIEVTSQDGLNLTRTEMQYDPLGRRIAKIHKTEQGALLSITHFLWEGLRLLAETRNGTSSLYLYEGTGYTPLARLDGKDSSAQVRYYHCDPNGMPQQVTDTSGKCVWQAYYSAWGATLQEHSEPAFIEGQNLRFQGQYLDRETGLHYNTFRFYDPDIGRFTSPDPIGLSGGVNLYQYAPNPSGWVDPWGWEVCRLSKADKAKMGPAPAGMVNPHRHHLVREKAPSSWSAANQKLVTDSQAILKKHGIGLNDDLRNFTWAQNGGGAHTIAAAKHTHSVLLKADQAGGLSAVETALKSLATNASKGIFF